MPMSGITDLSPQIFQMKDYHFMAFFTIRTTGFSFKINLSVLCFTGGTRNTSKPELKEKKMDENHGAECFSL